MGDIVWLASYPKSGNTWVRAFLVNYLNEGTDQSMRDLNMFALGDMDRQHYEACFGDEGFKKLRRPGVGEERFEVHAYIAETFTGNPVVKTHGNFRLQNGRVAFNLRVTKCAVYIVRNPLDVLVSFADHYGVTIDEVIRGTSEETHKISAQADLVEQYLGTWRSHVANWVSSQGFPKMLMRYEDMVRDPHRAFTQLAGFLKLGGDENRLARAIESASFETLRRKEEEEGFAEKSPHSERFFRRGTYGGWREVLTPEQVSRIVEFNGPIMRKLGYITDNGDIRF
ncbi:MAG: sulfotransferase domain-containing protein [Rhodospirillales bacterium]